MKAVVLHEYGGPEKLKFEDHVPEPQISGSTVLIAAVPLTSRPRIAGNDNGESFWRIPERSFQSMGLTLAAASSQPTSDPFSARHSPRP